MNAMFPNSSILSRNRLEFKDIEKVHPNFISELSAAQLLQSNPFFCQVEQLPAGSEFVYCFWVGMPYFTQVHILDLCACCDSVRTLVVFRDRKWRKADQILWILETPGQRKWNLSRKVVVSMSGSGEKKTACVFHCD